MLVRLLSIVLLFTGCWLIGQAPTWAYINGGTFHSTLPVFKEKLKTEGWSASFDGPIPSSSEVAKGVPFDPPDNPEYVHFVNQLVGQAVQHLPEDQSRAISIETKRELARLAREAIRDAASKGSAPTAEGKIGSLQYQLGTFRFSSYWETNYERGRRKIHAARAGVVPFIALKFSSANDRAETAR